MGVYPTYDRERLRLVFHAVDEQINVRSRHGHVPDDVDDVCGDHDDDDGGDVGARAAGGAAPPPLPRRNHLVLEALLLGDGLLPLGDVFGILLGGGFGHFYSYAPVKIKYAIDRFTMEAKRQLHLLDSVLAAKTFLCGERFTIADMAIYPWYGKIAQGSLYGAKEGLVSTVEPAGRGRRQVPRSTQRVALEGAFDGAWG